MIDLQTKTKYRIKYTSDFKKNYKKIKKQGKDVEKLKVVVSKLADGLELEEKYKNHMQLIVNIIKIVENVI